MLFVKCCSSSLCSFCHCFRCHTLGSTLWFTSFIHQKLSVSRCVSFLNFWTHSLFFFSLITSFVCLCLLCSVFVSFQVGFCAQCSLCIYKTCLISESLRCVHNILSIVSSFWQGRVVSNWMTWVGSKITHNSLYSALHSELTSSEIECPDV